MINIQDKTKCCGCTACFNICPKGCIEMKSDEEGFVYPVVNSAECVHCGLCDVICPINNTPEISSSIMNGAIVQNLDDNVLKESTSGGFVDSLYKYVLEELKGYAVGVQYDENFMPKHVITTSYCTAKKFRNSKYAQSNMQNIFKEIKNLLKKDKWVMFVGTPCQVAGLVNFLQKKYHKLITVDLVCRSIPSPKLWKMYLLWQESVHNSKIKKVSCRKKTYGYHSGSLEILFVNGKHYSGSNRVDYYMKSFHSDVCSRPSCYNCVFKTKKRCSDYTVFDSWAPEKILGQQFKDNDKGYSNVIIHSEKANDIIKKLGNVEIVKANPDDMFKYTGGMESNSIKLTRKRKEYYQELDKLGFLDNAKKFIKVSCIDKFIENLKPIKRFVKNIL